VLFHLRFFKVLIHVDTAISKIATVKLLTGNSTKPSFLLWDKVYRKLNSAEEEKWLLRAVDEALRYFAKDLARNESIRCENISILVLCCVSHLRSSRLQLGNMFLYLAVEGQTPELRKDVLDALEHSAHVQPVLVSDLVREAATPFLFGKDASKFTNKGGRLAGFMLSSAAFNEQVDPSTKGHLLAKSIILAHHAIFCQ
jgi:hypothetical protein